MLLKKIPSEVIFRTPSISKNYCEKKTINRRTIGYGVIGREKKK